MATDVQTKKNQDSSRSKVQNKWLQLFLLIFPFSVEISSPQFPQRDCFCEESFYFYIALTENRGGIIN